MTLTFRKLFGILKKIFLQQGGLKRERSLRTVVTETGVFLAIFRNKNFEINQS